MEIIPPTEKVDLFPASDFDAWAPGYDQETQAEAGFPFKGYAQTLSTLKSLAAPQPGMNVLDLGTGTGSLALLFAQAGCKVFATDFSPAMLDLARVRLPEVEFALADLRQPLPANFPVGYDRIVSAYVFHHFPLAEKIAILLRILKHLKPGGKLLVADLMFDRPEDWQTARQEAGTAWDEEYYWTVSEAQPALERAFNQTGYQIHFHKINIFAGIFEINYL